MKISYVNPANQETVTNVVSIHTRTLLIENTLKKYGDYTFTFQAFNDKNEAGAPMQVKAQSGLLPATATYSKGDKINVTADMLSTDDQEPSEALSRTWWMATITVSSIPAGHLLRSLFLNISR